MTEATRREAVLLAIKTLERRVTFVSRSFGDEVHRAGFGSHMWSLSSGQAGGEEYNMLRAHLVQTE